MGKPAVQIDKLVADASMTPVVAETKVIVSRTVKLDGADVDAATTEDVIEVHAFATTPAMAVVSVPVKLSRSFQSVGVEVGVYLPCYKEELPQAIEAAYEMVKERVMRELPLIKQALEDIAG
ncbi:MAG: hypothetical protein AB7L09_03100 [Nitrospira sp.]